MLPRVPARDDPQAVRCECRAPAEQGGDRGSESGGQGGSPCLLDREVVEWHPDAWWWENEGDRGCWAGGIDEPLVNTEGFADGLGLLAPRREDSRWSSVKRERRGGRIWADWLPDEEREPAAAPGVGASQSARSPRVILRRSCTSSARVGLPQYQ